MYFLLFRYNMFHFDKHFNRIIVITCACLILSAAPIFANAQPVVDSPANVKLQNIYERLGSMYQNCMVPQYNILSTYCNYKLSDINQSILAVGGQTADVSSKLITTNNYLSSIDSKIIDRNYTSLLQDLNNVNWINTNIISTVSIATDIAQTNPFYPDTSVLHNPGTYYIKLPDFPYNTSNYDTNLFRFDIPIRTNWTSLFNKEWITDVSIRLNSGGVYPGEYFWDIDVMKNGQYYIRFYLVDFIPYHGANLYIKFTATDDWRYASDDTKYVWYINSNNIDYLSFNDYLYIKQLSNNIQDLKNIYASDDVIAAKENQQAYEDQAITDFTGSGSAAASGSDTTNMKNVSGAIKSGLDSGGSVNGALGVFNTSGGLWDWFSQSNYDEINGTQTRSRGSDEYIDFYSINREELEELLGEYR